MLRLGANRPACVPSPLPCRRRAGAAHGRTIGAEAALIEQAAHQRFAPIGHAVAGRVGLAGGGIAVAAAGVAGWRRAPVADIHAALEVLPGHVGDWRGSWGQNHRRREENRGQWHVVLLAVAAIAHYVARGKRRFPWPSSRTRSSASSRPRPSR